MYGCPDMLYMDQGSQYTSEKFEDFLYFYKIEYKTSSPYNPYANMHNENCVKQAKNTLANWNQIKNKSKAIREKWIIDRVTGKTNKPRSTLTRMANKLMLARNQK